MRSSERRKALAHLRRVDATLAGVIATVGSCRLEARAEGTHLDALIRAIVYQQLSGKAAATIHARLRALYGGRSPTPAQLLATSDGALRSAGLSRQKMAYLRDLAARVRAAEVRIEHLHTLSDAEVVAELVRIKGVGRWTAQMFLIFRLGRLDVLPDLDLGVQTAIMRAYRLPRRPTPTQVLALGAKWSPYASVAAWYLWRSLDARPGRKPRAARTR